MTRDEAIKTAAEWWANKLRQKEQHSNGDTSDSSVLACMLADFGTGTVTEEQLKLFTAELERKLSEDMDRYPSRFRFTYLCCDYGPCQLLHGAAQKAGIPTLNFPFKTSMMIEMVRDGCYIVRVSDGYGAQYIEIASSCNERAAAYM